MTLPNQLRCNVMYVLTPLLRSICFVMSSTMTGAKTRRVLCARGVRAECAIDHCLVNSGLLTEKLNDAILAEGTVGEVLI